MDMSSGSKITVHGAHIALLHELCLEDRSTLSNFVRMDQQYFAESFNFSHSLWSLKFTHMYGLIY